MHNGNLKCLRTKNGRALWANMDARSPSHLSRSRESLRTRSRDVCRVPEGGFMCRRRHLGARRRPALSADRVAR